MTRVRTWRRGQRRFLAITMLVALCAAIGCTAILPATNLGLAQQAEIVALEKAYQAGSSARDQSDSLESARNGLLEGNWRNALHLAANQNDASAHLKSIVEAMSAIEGIALRSGITLDVVEDGATAVQVVVEGDSAATALFLETLHGHKPRLWIDSLQIERSASGRLAVTADIRAIWLPNKADSGS